LEGHGSTFLKWSNLDDGQMGPDTSTPASGEMKIMDMDLHGSLLGDFSTFGTGSISDDQELGR